MMLVQHIKINNKIKENHLGFLENKNNGKTNKSILFSSSLKKKGGKRKKIKRTAGSFNLIG